MANWVGIGPETYERLGRRNLGRDERAELAAHKGGVHRDGRTSGNEQDEK